MSPGWKNKWIGQLYVIFIFVMQELSFLFVINLIVCKRHDWNQTWLLFFKNFEYFV